MRTKEVREWRGNGRVGGGSLGSSREVEIGRVGLGVEDGPFDVLGTETVGSKV